MKVLFIAHSSELPCTEALKMIAENDDSIGQGSPVELWLYWPSGDILLLIKKFEPDLVIDAGCDTNFTSDLMLRLWPAIEARVIEYRIAYEAQGVAIMEMLDDGCGSIQMEAVNELAQDTRLN